MDAAINSVVDGSMSSYANLSFFINTAWNGELN
jgi:hypothetical protein